MALTDNLVAYYKLDEASGNAADSTGNGNTATNNNSATYSAGKINNGVQLGAANTNKWFNTSTAMGINTANSGNLTVAGWVWLDSVPSAGQTYNLFGFCDIGNPQLEFVCANDFDIPVMKLVRWNGSSAQTLQWNSVPSASSWNHLSFTKSGTSVTFYLNGTSIGALTITLGDGNGSAGVDRFAFGRHPNASAGFTRGGFDELGVWTRSLSSGEITELYNGGAGLSHPFITSVPSGFFNFF